ncbi:MAG: hypothetical protein RLZZ165_140 [Bacteroidota bacterium]|jgi:3-phenylpropionate/trans-cinnamate dioxygenase ferredoxin subunit
MMDELDPDTEWIRAEELTMMGARFVPEGKLRKVTVNGVAICLVRRGNALLAIRDRCPHGGGPLHQGFLDEEGNVVCPWHRFRFCPEDGKSAGGEGYATESFPVHIHPHGTYIGFPKRKKWFGLF